jgi:hypothetical protein
MKSARCQGCRWSVDGLAAIRPTAPPPAGGLIAGTLRYGALAFDGVGVGRKSNVYPFSLENLRAARTVAHCRGDSTWFSDHWAGHPIAACASAKHGMRPHRYTAVGSPTV